MSIRCSHFSLILHLALGKISVHGKVMFNIPERNTEHFAKLSQKLFTEKSCALKHVIRICTCFPDLSIWYSIIWILVYLWPLWLIKLWFRPNSDDDYYYYWNLKLFGSINKKGAYATENNSFRVSLYLEYEKLRMAASLIHTFIFWTSKRIMQTSFNVMMCLFSEGSFITFRKYITQAVSNSFHLRCNRLIAVDPFEDMLEVKKQLEWGEKRIILIQCPSRKYRKLLLLNKIYPVVK